MAIIPEIVGSNQVMNAISLSSMGMTVFRLIGPVMAGFLIAAWDFSIVYYLMTFMYIVAAGFALRLPLTGEIKTSYRKSNPLADIAVDTAYRGRMQSFVMMNSGLASLGTFLTGVLAESIGIQWSLGGMAMLLVAVSLIFITCAPKLAKLD